MIRCDCCDSVLVDGRCGVCDEGERARFRALKKGAFPETALPPLGLSESPALSDLRRSLVRGDFRGAEDLWAALLRTVQPLGVAGRGQLADCFEACACLKEALDKPADARRLRQRAASMRKAPADLQRKASLGQSGRAAWDSHPWLKKQALDRGAPAAETIKKVNEELDRVETRGERTRSVLKLGAAGLAGLWCSVVTGLPMAVMVLLGAGLGWLWARKA